MTKKVDVEGEIDASFSSYYNPEEHGSMKTVSGTTDDDKGTDEMVTIPKEVDIDTLTEKREHIIREAAKNPKVTTTQLEKICSTSTGYISKVLREECPNWYDNVFKEHGNSYSASQTTTESPSETTEVEDDATDQPTVEKACRLILATSENQELKNFAEWVLEQ